MVKGLVNSKICILPSATMTMSGFKFVTVALGGMVPPAGVLSPFKSQYSFYILSMHWVM